MRKQTTKYWNQFKRMPLGSKAAVILVGIMGIFVLRATFGFMTGAYTTTTDDDTSYSKEDLYDVDGPDFTAYDVTYDAVGTLPTQEAGDAIYASSGFGIVLIVPAVGLLIRKRRQNNELI